MCAAGSIVRRGDQTGLVSERPWSIDPELASDLAAALSWAPADGAGVLARRFAERIPTGSTAKLAAVAEGRVPPGAEVDALAHQILGGLRGDRRESPAWTCWVVSSVFASIVDTLGPGTARVAALRRIDDRSPVVDIHSVVIAEGAAERSDEASTWVCDPYFGTAVALPGALLDVDEPSAARRASPIALATHASPPDEHAGACAVTLEDDGRWTFEVRLRIWEGWLRYRVLAPQLDRADLAAFCAISATHSGAPDFAYARLHRPGGMDTVRVDPDGTTTCSRRSWDGPAGPVSDERTTVRTWPEGVAAFAAATGVTIGE